MTENEEKYHGLRHSAAHIMASAVLELYPQTKFGIGPVIADGFYYDFLLDERLSSKSAKQSLILQKTSPSKNKESIDSTAASLILQEYLDSK